MGSINTIYNLEVTLISLFKWHLPGLIWRIKHHVMDFLPFTIDWCIFRTVDIIKAKSLQS